MYCPMNTRDCNATRVSGCRCGGGSLEATRFSSDRQVTICTNDQFACLRQSHWLSLPLSNASIAGVGEADPGSEEPDAAALVDR